MLCLRAIEIVHRGVQPGEDGRGDVEWQLLMEELLLLRLAHEDSVIHGHMLATSFCVYCQVLEVRHSWKDERTDGRLSLSLALLSDSQTLSGRCRVSCAVPSDGCVNQCSNSGLGRWGEEQQGKAQGANP